MAVKASAELAAALVSGAASVRVGGRLLVKRPIWTTTSRDSGIVPPFPTGVMWIPDALSLKVRPIRSAESFFPSDVPGVLSRSSDD